jgi:hypothetical protein
MLGLGSSSNKSRGSSPLFGKRANIQTGIPTQKSTKNKNK